MPSWISFGSKKKPDPPPLAARRPKPRPAPPPVLPPNVSTMSSTEEIMRSVSEANASSSHDPKIAVKLCICCGTQLQIPAKVPSFKCKICDTLHDVGPIAIRPAKSLTFDALKKSLNALERASRTKSDAPGEVSPTYGPRLASLDYLLSAWFSSVANVNQAFALGQTRPSYSKPNIDYGLVASFYALVLDSPVQSEHLMNTVLTAQATLLKRIKKSLDAPTDICFLLVILENPVLYMPSLFTKRSSSAKRAPTTTPEGPKPPPFALEILERAVGILAHCNKDLHHYLFNWLSRVPVPQFEPKVDLLNAYVAHRLTHHYRSHHSRPRAEPRDRCNSTPSTEREYNLSSSSVAGVYYGSRPKKRRSSVSAQIKSDLYNTDWKIDAFVKVIGIFFKANTVSSNKIPVSSFYNTMVDYTDVTADFDEWQKTFASTSAPRVDVAIPPFKITPRFAFCQYPFLLSMGSKTEILEYDARRQMELRAQEAFFGSLASRTPESPFLYIRVHRDAILSESFDAIEKNEDNLKKGLRVEFIDEPGVDAGGLKKEWFLLLFKELFDSNKNFFVEEEESRFCWFDASSDHALKYYKLTGVAIGLALYNSTILDVNFPPVLFKKLLGCPYTLEDFTEYKPSHGRNLRKLLEYEEDDLEEVFSLDFCVYTRNKDGSIVETPLIADGKNVPVTRSNRQDYVRRVMAYYFDTSVKRQFDSLKQGFNKVVGGSALSLFRPEEIELLIRGSLEPIDVDALRAVTRYQHWGSKGREADQVDVIRWFWKFFKNLDPVYQRKLLIFVTGSDRLPATGIANMPFRISRIGDDSNRFPISHTCFNQLCLYAYSSKEKLASKIMTAITESQGFGIK